MPNVNTARRALYLPPELDAWFAEKSESTGRKVNALIIDAMVAYSENIMNETIEFNHDFESAVKKIVNDMRTGEL